MKRPGCFFSTPFMSSLMMRQMPRSGWSNPTMLDSTAASMPGLVHHPHMRIDVAQKRVQQMHRVAVLVDPDRDLVLLPLEQKRRRVVMLKIDDHGFPTGKIGGRICHASPRFANRPSNCHPRRASRGEAREGDPRFARFFNGDALGGKPYQPARPGGCSANHAAMPGMSSSKPPGMEKLSAPARAGLRFSKS